MEYISDRITKEMVANWNKGDYIFIDAQTGRGKTTFVMNNVHAVAKERNTKILYLYNRIALGKQTIDEIKELKKQDHINTMSYQLLAKLSFDWNGIPQAERYDYIVCDEVHYFLADALFNATTNVALEALLDNKRAVTIMLSATGKKMIEYLKHEHKLQIETHTLERDYSYITELMYFDKFDELIEIVKTLIHAKKKFLLFVGNAQDGLDIHNLYKDETLFNCSKSKKNYSNYISEEMPEVLSEEKFIGKLGLITTTALDNGVNINDDDLEYIIIYKIHNMDTAIQCIGRKRINNEDEEVKLIVKTWSKQSINMHNQRNKDSLEKLRVLRYSGEDEFLATYQNPENLRGIYTVKRKGILRYKYNKLLYYKMELDEKIRNSMYDKMCVDPDAYKKFFAKELGIKRYWNYNDIVTVRDIDEYLYYNFVRKELMMNKQDQKELALRLNMKNHKGRLFTGIGTMNDELERINSKYRLESKRPYVVDTETNKKKQVTMWEVKQIL